MGVREVRYCDVSGAEDGVELHELHVDQMRVEIDLSGDEYQRLLELLGPYIDAGRVEAGAPGRARPARRAESRSAGLTAEERLQVREWALAEGIDVPSNNRFKKTVVAQWRQATAEPDPV